MENHERREEWYWVKLCNDGQRVLAVLAYV